MKTEWKIFGAALLLGLVVGGLVGREGVPRWAARKPSPDRMFKRFCRHLDLREDQKPEIRRILDAGHQRMQELWKDVGPRFEEIRSATNAQIRQKLDPAQQEKFDRMERRQRRRMHRFLPAGPPPRAP